MLRLLRTTFLLCVKATKSINKIWSSLSVRLSVRARAVAKATIAEQACHGGVSESEQNRRALNILKPSGLKILVL